MDNDDHNGMIREVIVKQSERKSSSKKGASPEP